jgi:hypothetical protein
VKISVDVIVEDVKNSPPKQVEGHFSRFLRAPVEKPCGNCE